MKCRGDGRAPRVHNLFTSQSDVRKLFQGITPHSDPPPVKVNKTISFSSIQQRARDSSTSETRPETQIPSISFPCSIKSRGKGEHGRLLIIGGSEMYSGAPAFVALSSLKIGIDMVQVYCEPTALTSIRSFSPNIMAAGLLPNVRHVKEIQEQLEQDSQPPLRIPFDSDVPKDISSQQIQDRIHLFYDHQMRNKGIQEYVHQCIDKLHENLGIPPTKIHNGMTYRKITPPAKIAMSIGSGLGREPSALMTVTFLVAILCMYSRHSTSPLARAGVLRPLILDAEALYCIPALVPSLRIRQWMDHQTQSKIDQDIADFNSKFKSNRPAFKGGNKSDNEDQKEHASNMSDAEQQESQPQQEHIYRPYKNVYLTPNKRELLRLYEAMELDCCFLDSPVPPQPHGGSDPGVIPGSQWIIPHLTQIVYLGDTLAPDDETCRMAVRIARALGNVTILVKGETDIVTDGVIIAFNSYHHGGQHRCGGLGDLNAGALATFSLWLQDRFYTHIVPMLIKSDGGDDDAKDASLLSYVLTPATFAAIMSSTLIKISSEDAYKQKTFSMNALDVIEELPKILRM